MPAASNQEWAEVAMFQNMHADVQGTKENLHVLLQNKVQNELSQ